MKENITYSSRSLPNENLKHIGYGCSFPGCDWWLSGEIPYHKALELHGKHNSEKHINTTDSTIVWVYKDK